MIAIQHRPVDVMLGKTEEPAFDAGGSTDVVEVPWEEHARIAAQTLLECGGARET